MGTITQDRPVSERLQRVLEQGPPALYANSKRIFDVAVALTLLTLLAPLLLLVALVIKLQDGGPVFFTQTRVGQNGVLFPFFKFRSMRITAEAEKRKLQEESDSGIRFKMERDPRVTRLGRMIRKLSIDELPQLWNVLRGDMSLVGPRPPVPSEVAEYTPRQRRRLAVQQGLTCFWQVRGRSLLTFDEQVEMDLDYIRERNFWLDVSLVLLTVPAVLTGRGAY